MAKDTKRFLTKAHAQMADKKTESCLSVKCEFKPHAVPLRPCHSGRRASAARTLAKAQDDALPASSQETGCRHATRQLPSWTPTSEKAKNINVHTKPCAWSAALSLMAPKCHRPTRPPTGKRTHDRIRHAVWTTARRIRTELLEPATTQMTLWGVGLSGKIKNNPKRLHAGFFHLYNSLNEKKKNYGWGTDPRGAEGRRREWFLKRDTGPAWRWRCPGPSLLKRIRQPTQVTKVCRT